MKRRIINIDEEKCNGCGACAKDCHEGDIGIVNGKAKLLGDDYCDGLGDCLPTCPTNAITFVEREAAADCTAYAYGNFHEKFIKDRITLIGCPKLDSVDYSEKLTEIFTKNDILSITVTRMEVPCCGGLEFAVKKAIVNSDKDIPLDVVTISTNGIILD